MNQSQQNTPCGQSKDLTFIRLAATRTPEIVQIAAAESRKAYRLLTPERSFRLTNSGSKEATKSPTIWWTTLVSPKARVKTLEQKCRYY